jgi:hypothetical protein
MGARTRVGIGLSHRPARLHRLAELVPWNRFLGSIKDKNSDSVDSIGLTCNLFYIKKLLLVLQMSLVYETE